MSEALLKIKKIRDKRLGFLIDIALAILLALLFG